MQCFYELSILSAKPSHTHFFPLKIYEFPFQRYTTIAAHPFLPFEKLGIHSEDTLQLAPTDFFPLKKLRTHSEYALQLHPTHPFPLLKNYESIPKIHNCNNPVTSDNHPETFQHK